jgi:hypothetical protein
MRRRRLCAAVLLLSCMLAVMGCGLFSKALPPCNRVDLQPSYDAQGHLMRDVTAVSNRCLDRMIGDLDACYGAAR